MGKSTAWQSGHLKLVFQNVAFASIGDSGGLLSSSASGNLYVSLHTSDPGNSSLQNLYEATYSGYARVSVPRGTSYWTVTGSACTNAASITFPISGGTDNTISHFGVGVSPTGSGLLLYSGSFNTSKTFLTGDTPIIQTNLLLITES